MSDRPAVSVVTPFHNTAPFLGDCIESVLAQTLGDIEYLLVNNCSDDGSAEIARSYAARDPRIRCIDQPGFLNQVGNFNSALQSISSSSRYCKLVLADDLLLPECLSQMVRVAERWPRVGLVSSYCIDGPELKGGGLPFPDERFDGRMVARRQLLDGQFFFGSPSTVLYRSEIVRRRPAFFPSGRYHEDTEVAYEILREWDFGFVHQVLSYLRARGDSLSGRASSYQPHLLDAYIILRQAGREFLTPDEYRRLERYLTRRYFGFLGVAALYRRDADFWDYHRQGLATVGETFRGWRRLRYAVSGAAHLLLHPIDTARALARRAGMGRV